MIHGKKETAYYIEQPKSYFHVTGVKKLKVRTAKVDFHLELEASFASPISTLLTWTYDTLLFIAPKRRRKEERYL